MSDTNKEIYYDMLLKMLHTRKFEEKVAHLFSLGKVHGTMHLYIGQEATGIGACCAIKDTDLITSTHRGHGHCIGKGIDLKIMMAEFLGKATGCCKGKGGSMHIADFSAGNLGANGVVAGGIPIATGAAYTQKMKKTGNIVVCFFGDGASNQGSFHEAVNMASALKLPVIFICENNLYAMSTPIKQAMNITDIADRAAAYGIKGIIVDGNNVLEVYKTVKEMREYVLENGPILIESKTYRWLGHSKSDANVYRTKEEIAAWKKKCPILRFETYLINEGIFSKEEIEKLELQADNDIERAYQFAEASPYPEINSVTDDVYTSI